MSKGTSIKRENKTRFLEHIEDNGIEVAVALYYFSCVNIQYYNCV